MIVKEPIRCEKSLNIEGGVLRYSVNALGSVATLSCILPYTLNDGNQFYVCNLQGNWIGNGQCGNTIIFIFYKNLLCIIQNIIIGLMLVLLWNYVYITP